MGSPEHLNNRDGEHEACETSIPPLDMFCLFVNVCVFRHRKKTRK